MISWCFNNVLAIVPAREVSDRTHQSPRERQCRYSAAAAWQGPAAVTRHLGGPRVQSAPRRTTRTRPRMTAAALESPPPLQPAPRAVRSRAREGPPRPATTPPPTTTAQHFRRSEHDLLPCCRPRAGATRPAGASFPSQFDSIRFDSIRCESMRCDAITLEYVPPDGRLGLGE